MQEENLHVTLQTACSEALMNVTQQGSSTSGIEQDFALNKRDTFQDGTTAGTSAEAQCLADGLRKLFAFRSQPARRSSSLKMEQMNSCSLSTLTSRHPRLQVRFCLVSRQPFHENYHGKVLKRCSGLI